MAKYVQKTCKIYADGLNLTSYINNINLTVDNNLQDATNYNGYEESVPGITKSTFDYSGFVDNSENGVEQDSFEKIGSTADVLTVCAVDGAAGDVAFSMQSMLTKISNAGNVGELYKFTISAKGNSKVTNGTVMVNGALTATGTGTARQLGTVSATQKLYAAMHVTAISGTDTPTLGMVIQSDNAEAFTTPTGRITFSNATAVSAQWATPVAGAIADDWWRLSYTISGTNPSFTVIVVIGIENN